MYDYVCGNCGYGGVNGLLLENNTPTWFMNKYHEHKEKEKEAHDIKIGDEVVLITSLVNDDSVRGIVYNIIEAAECPKYYRMVSSGSSISFTFSDNSIINGMIHKTGNHFDYIPFNYIA